MHLLDTVYAATLSMNKPGMNTVASPGPSAAPETRTNVTDSDLLTTEQAAAILGVSPKMFRETYRRLCIPVQREGIRNHYRRGDVLAAVERYEQKKQTLEKRRERAAQMRQAQTAKEPEAVQVQQGTASVQTAVKPARSVKPKVSPALVPISNKLVVREIVACIQQQNATLRRALDVLGQAD